MTTEKKTIIKQGKVVRTSMQKTIVVAVSRTHQHPLYRKVVRKVKNYKVHDPREEACVGDIVDITEVRPISKTKAWMLSQIVRTADTGEPEISEETVE